MNSLWRSRWITQRVVLAAFAAFAAIVASSAHAARPNVLLIVIDDVGYADLSCMGLVNDIATPRMDQLAASGVRFTQAYATSPICNASRVALATGVYQQRHGIYWYGGKRALSPDYPTLAETMKKNGYATSYIGKYHFGKDGSGERSFPLNHGFDRFFGFGGGTKHYLNHKRSYVLAAGKKDWLHQGPLWNQREREDTEGFTTELFGQHAIRFIDNHASQPFFLQISFNAAHNYTYQLPVEYLEKHGLSKFPDLDLSKEKYWEWRGRLGYPAHPEGRAYYRGQLELMDREIGRVVDHVEQLGLAENTAIFIVGDNGGSLTTYANNRPLKGGKYTLFEGGVRVPMIASWPGHVMGKRVFKSATSSLDLVPTILSLTGTQSPASFDGVDLSETLLSKEPELSTAGDRALFWDTKHQSAVRRGKWKLLVTNKSPFPKLQITPTPSGTFLYDVETDPGETNNLATAHPEIAAELKKALIAWSENVGTSRP